MQKSVWTTPRLNQLAVGRRVAQRTKTLSNVSEYTATTTMQTMYKKHYEGSVTKMLTKTVTGQKFYFNTAQPVS